MWPNPQETEDLFTFTEEILNGKLHFLSSDSHLSLPMYPLSARTIDKINQNECE